MTELSRMVREMKEAADKNGPEAFVRLAPYMVEMLNAFSDKDRLVSDVAKEVDEIQQRYFDENKE